MSVKTVEAARALPEVRDPYFYDEVKTLDDGTTVVERRWRPLCGRGVEGDDILAFTDSDGRFMRVIQTEDGPAKTEFQLGL